MARHLKKDDFKRLMRSRYWLRGHFLLMLACTALVTLGASHVLLTLGLQNILLRYLICLLFSYLCFLLLLRIWLGLYIFPKRPTESPVDALDALDMPLAVGDWGDGTGPAMPKVEIPSLGDLDEDSAPLVLPLIAIVALVALTLFLVSAVGIAVYTAPAVLCEVAFEMAVTIGLVRLTVKEKDLTKGYWLWAALRGTALPFLGLLVAVMLGLGIVLHYYPAVSKLSDIWQRSTVNKCELD